MTPKQHEILRTKIHNVVLKELGSLLSGLHLTNVSKEEVTAAFWNEVQELANTGVSHGR